MNNEIFECEDCGTKVSKYESFCPNCHAEFAIENEEKTKNINKKLIIIISVIIAFLLITISTIFIICKKNENYDKEQKQLYTSFYVDLGNFNYSIKLTLSYLNTVGNTIHTYWHDAIWEDKFDKDINKAVQQAYDDEQDSIYELKYDYNDIKNKYKNLVTNYKNCKLCETKMFDILEEEYNNYILYYNFIMDTGGYSYTTFGNAYSSYKTNLNSSINKMNSML